MKLTKLLPLTTLIAAVITAHASSYTAWKRRIASRLQTESTVIETAVGLVEFYRQGTGPVVIFTHGTPGGFDQGIAFANMLGNMDRTFITPSRPGYLRTPLSSGVTSAQQGDLYAALLDALGIERAAIIGISGGGPSALEFAARHPTHCSGLIMISGIAQHYSEYALKQSLSPLARFFRLVYEKASTFDPVLHFLLPIASLLPNASATIAILNASAMYHLRKAGYDNDIEQFEITSSYPLEQIVAPTLVIHGTADGEVPFTDAQLIARKVPQSILLSIKGGDHTTFFTRSNRIVPTLRAFLETL